MVSGHSDDNASENVGWAMRYLYPLPILFFLGCTSPDRRGALTQLRSGDAICYSWIETMGAEDLENRGGIVFLKRGNKVYSRAWHSSPGTEWPPVEGAGYLADSKLHMAYRTVFGQPEHEFYHAYCEFDFAKTGQSLSCTFIQKATPEADAPLSPGAARGILVRKPDGEFQQQIRSVTSLADALSFKPVPSGHCRVMPLWPSSPGSETLANGKSIKLCCPSCVQVFSVKLRSSSKVKVESE